jgi:dienelactone hydrolase
MKVDRRAFITAVAGIVALAVAPLAAEEAQRAVRFPSGNETPILGQLLTPKGPGPLPAVVLLHHCGGLRSFNVAWAKTIQTAGYVALLVDSFGPRALTSICSADTRESARMAAERVHDAYGALRYLKTLPFVDAEHVAVMGWSHGASTVLDALSSDRYRTSSEQFKAGVAMYPACARFASARVRAPLLVLVGSKDDWTPPTPCLDLERLRRPGAPPIRVHVYEGAYHVFDDPSYSGGTMSYLGHTLGYSPVATKDAEARVIRFLQILRHDEVFLPP